MEKLRCLIEALEPLWRNFCLDLIDGRSTLWAMVMNPSVDVCSCLRGQFIPSKGLDVLPGNFIEISIGERIKDLKRFDWVGCTGFVLSDDILVPTQGAALWKVPNFDKNSAFCFTHLFGGAFNGWSRATTFLSSTNIIDIMNTTSIDHDSEVMKV